MRKGAHTLKVRDEGHWRPAIDGQMVDGAMSSDPQNVTPLPKGSGPMIVFGSTAVVVGEPGLVHQAFFAQVHGLAHQHRSEPK